MTRLCPSSALARCLVMMAAGFGALAYAAPPPPPISLAEYRSHLESLDRVVIACQRAIGPSNCKSDQVGADVLVDLPAVTGVTAPRDVRFGWLRDLLDQAAKPEASAHPSAASGTGAKARPSDPSHGAEAKKPTESDDTPDSRRGTLILIDSQIPQPTIPERLKAARDRLREDWQRAGELSNRPRNPAVQDAANLTARQQALKNILAAKEYQVAIANRSLGDRVREKLNHWFQIVAGKLGEVGAKAKWIGLTAEIGFILLLCVVLVWFLVRLERRGKLWSVSSSLEPGAGAASARDWQLWLQDAQQAAARGAWRDAIHLTYWASISRLESSGLWPADRARTPREYLALLGEESLQRSDLTTLTRSFERTWYAGRAAAEADFLDARQSAARLGAK